MKLRKLLEYDDKLAEYSVKLTDFIASKLKNVDGWTPHVDSRSGTLEWSNKKSKYIIYATPFWEGKEHFTLDIAEDGSGEHVYDKDWKWKPTYDLKKDLVAYNKKIKQVIQFVGKNLK